MPPRSPPLHLTLARPGTEAKILAMMARHQGGEFLFHEDDALELVRAPAGQTGPGQREGINWSIRNQKWRARHWKDGHLRHIGYYATRYEARVAIQKAEHK